MSETLSLYIAGPMSGKEHYNVAAFEAARIRWAQLGHEVVTPFDANSMVWRRHYGRDFDPTKDVCDWGNPILAEMFAADIDLLARADGIVLLSGWEHSRGATTEAHIAAMLGKRVFLDSTGIEIPLASTLSFRMAA